jgi:aspartate aminotransferase
MPFSRAARSIGASVTLQLNAEAARMRSAGEPVVHLGGGEPKSNAPQAAIEAGKAMLDTGQIRYTPAAGTQAMRDAVVAYTEMYYDRRVDRANVMASAGAKQAIMVALLALVDPGDEVVYPVPYWVSYPEMVKLAGGVAVPVAAKDGSFQPTVDEMLAAITDQTRVVLLNSPSNPSGKVFDRDFLQPLIRHCEEHDIFVLMDDIYHRLVFDGREFVHAYMCTDRPVDESKVVILNGVSKQYAMTGFRIGWAVGPKDLIRAMANIQSHQSGNPCSLSQHAAVAAIHGAQGSVGTLRKTLEANRDVMVEKLQEIPGLEVARPEGTFYCFADFRNFDTDSTRLAARLLDRVQVVTVPGVEFGMEGYLRLSYCGPVEDAIEGARRIKWLLDPDGPDTLEARGKIFTR